MTIGDKKYNCNEQFYFSTKAQEYGDDNAFRDIMKQTDPKEMMRIGRRATNYNNIDWNKREIDVMTKANVNKFAQNEGARAALRATGTTRLGEASNGSSSGKFWGTGFPMTHKDSTNTNKWHQNKMGDILTKIRGDLPQLQLQLQGQEQEEEAMQP